MEDNKKTQANTSDERARPDGGDTTYGSDFAFRANQLSEQKWRQYNTIGGIIIGIIMGVMMFAIPGEVLSDTVRLLIAFIVGILPSRFLETRAERSMKRLRNCMALTFIACMFLFVGYLIISGKGL